MLLKCEFDRDLRGDSGKTSTDIKRLDFLCTSSYIIEKNAPGLLMTSED